MKVRRDMRRTFGISKRLSQRQFHLTHEYHPWETY
jgi:hypothetical protein